MTGEEVEAALTAADVHVAAVHPDAVVIEIECESCGVHAVMACPTCPHDEPSEECPVVAEVLEVTGGRVIV